MANIAFIPVRGGSKSIPLKNIKPLCDRPLVYWVIAACEEATCIDKIIIATDSQLIADTVSAFKFKKLQIYHRLAENAQDTSSTESVMLEYILNTNLNPNDYFFLIQATSPLTRAYDIDAAFCFLLKEKKDSLLSCVLTKRFFWTASGEAINYDFYKRPRRQDFNGLLMENGAIYINKVENILKFKNRLSGSIAVYTMPEYTGIEIDEPDDWNILEVLMKKYIIPSRCPDLHTLKLILTDVDGVLTDSGMYYSEYGDELKKFNTRDGMGFELLRKHGIKTGIITSENTQLVKKRAEKLKADYVIQNKKYGDKLSAVLEICKNEGLSMSEIAYIGDDINCFSLLTNVGFAACPSDAASEIKQIPGIKILSRKGGEGAFRELVDMFCNTNL